MNATFVILFLAMAIWSVYSAYQCYQFRTKFNRTCDDLRVAETNFREVEGITRHRVKNEYKEAAESQLTTKLATLNQKFTEVNAHLMAQALVSPRVTELKDDLNKLLEVQFSRMNQEFVGRLVDESDAVKAELILNIGDKIWDRLQQVKEKFKDSPYVLPQDCKLAYTRGNRTVVVVEQKPQMRSVTFNHKLVSQAVSQEAAGKTPNGFRFSLAFPHVLFFIVFDKGKYVYHEIYFRNKPLLSTREYVYLAPIPNIFRDRGANFKPMCMGEQFAVDKGDTLARQCEYAVSMFWQSTFNDHLGDGGSDKIDKRIKNWAEWQKQSLNDPLFVLNVQWKQGRTAKGVIESILEMRDHKHELDAMDKEIKSQIDAGVTSISTSVKEAVSAAKIQKFKDLDSVKDQIETILVKHSDEVFAACTKI